MFPLYYLNKNNELNKNEQDLNEAIVFGKSAKNPICGIVLKDGIKKEEKKDLPKGMMNQNNEYFLNPGDAYVKKLNKEKEKNPNNYLGDAYLGDIATVSDAANIVCRDFEYVDGDRVRIMVNDEVVVQNLTLDSSFRGIYLKFGEGFNKIDFIALNQGDSGPNTAELRIYDDNKKLISSNQWNLATGAKATLIIVKK